MSFVVFNCQSCGAAIEVQPDNMLTVCIQCGSIYPAKELGDVPVYIVPSAAEDKIRQTVMERMRLDKDMRGVARSLTIERADGVYVPLFIQKSTARGHWKGYENKKRGDETIKVWKEGDIAHESDFPVVARKHAHEFGLNSLGRVIFEQVPVAFESVTWTDAKLPVLAVDIDETHVDLVVEDELVDKLGEAIRRDQPLNAITEFEVDVGVDDRFILLYPLWTVIYRFRKGSYRVAVAGAAQPRVLAAMEPVFLGRRLKHLVLGAWGIVGSGILWAVGSSLLIAGADDVGEAVVAVFAAMGFCIWLAWRTATKLVASVHVEHLAEEENPLK